MHSPYLIQGQNYNIPAFFKDDSNNPLILTSPVEFDFRDAQQSLILSGICLQDNIDPSKWIANLTIANNLPLSQSDDDYYVLNYTANLPNNSTKQFSRIFQVISDKINILNQEIPVVLTLDSLVKDNLLIPFPYTLDKYEVYIKDYAGNIYLDSGITLNPPIYITNNNYNIYLFQSSSRLQDILPGGTYPGMLQVEWHYTVNDQDFVKINPLYIINNLAFTLMNSLKMTLNHGNIRDINPNLIWKDYELLFYIMTGIQRVNGTNPPTNFDITTLPSAMFYAVQKAALAEALQAQLYAEGLSQFDFQGQSISLSVDRTQSIQALLDQTNGWLDNNLTSIKPGIQVLTSRGGRAVTTITPSKTSNFPSFAGQFMPGWQLPK